MNSLLEAFDMQGDGHELISLVGAGGKTTAMFALAQALKTQRKRILATTTTNIFYPGTHECDAVMVSESPELKMFHSIPCGSVTVLGARAVNERKLSGVDKEFLDTLHQSNLLDCILVECDGSKRKPVKAPAHYEPLVPDTSTRTIGVIGLDAVGQPIDEEHVHRAEILSAVVGRGAGEPLDVQAVVELIVSPQGLFKGVPESCPRYVLLNKADTAERKGHAAAIVEALLQKSDLQLKRCVTGALAAGTIYGSVPLR